MVDTGYCTHSSQTAGLIHAALHERPLDRIINTHLHSDHCGGNALLQAHYPHCQTFIPPGSAHAVAAWDEEQLSYAPTGQSCPRFEFQHLLHTDQSIELGTQAWEIHSAPGHDPHSVVLFEPQTRTLISADALWENGFGVVFQELEGVKAFDEVSATLDLIERLSPRVVIPGHGAVFTDVTVALSRARTRLAKFASDPIRHAHYGAKVLLKYKLLEWQQCSRIQLDQWTRQTPYFSILHHRFFSDQSKESWVESLLADLQRSQALHLVDDMIFNRD